MLQKIQRFGGAMFAPAMLFSISGLMVGISALATTVDIVGDLATYGTPWYVFWAIIQRGSWTVFKRLPLLFAVALPIGLAQKQPARCCLEALVAYFAYCFFLSEIIKISGNNLGLQYPSFLAPATGITVTVYDGYIIESYCFYDGKLYALAFTKYADKPDGYTYVFGQIINGAFSAISSELKYSQVPNFVPYGWNGKIYFKMSEPVIVKDAQGKDTSVDIDKLYSYDIAGGGIEKVCDYKINTSFFDGHVMYFLAYDTDGNYDLNLYAISLQAPGAVTTVGEFPKTTNVRNRSIYKYDDKFYCLSSFNRYVYSMDNTGSTRLALICGGVYDSMNFTADKLVLIPNTLTTSNANELKVYNAKSMAARSLYGDWLGQSVYYTGARFVPENGKGYYSTTESVSTVTNIPITVTKAFSRGSDFIVQTKYTNLLDTGIKLRSYIVKVYLDGQLVAHDLNRMVGIEMKTNDIETFTFVIAGADVLQSFDVADGRISVEVIPTYDIIPEKTDPSPSPSPSPTLPDIPGLTA